MKQPANITLGRKVYHPQRLPDGVYAGQARGPHAPACASKRRKSLAWDPPDLGASWDLSAPLPAQFPHRMQGATAARNIRATPLLRLAATPCPPRVLRTRGRRVLPGLLSTQPPCEGVAGLSPARETPCWAHSPIPNISHRQGAKNALAGMGRTPKDGNRVTSPEGAFRSMESKQPNSLDGATLASWRFKSFLGSRVIDRRAHL